MRKLASIQIIRNITPIEGADRIELATINNWNVVVAKDVNHKIGDKVVYCEIDSFLPIEPEFEFLRKTSFKKMVDIEGFRLKTIRLRGVYSQGLVIPLKDAIDVIKRRNGEVYYEMLQIGHDVSDLLGIQKYEAPIPANLSGKIKGNFPSFLKKTDEERCISGDTIIITEDGEKTIKEICDTKYNGKVLSYNTILNKNEYNNIISHNTQRNNNDWYKITIEDGTEIIVTSNHKIWLPELQCYREVKDLQVNDFIQKTDSV